MTANTHNLSALRCQMWSTPRLHERTPAAAIVRPDRTYWLKSALAFSIAATLLSVFFAVIKGSPLYLVAAQAIFSIILSNLFLLPLALLAAFITKAGHA